jgi:hypothetical protein
MVGPLKLPAAVCWCASERLSKMRLWCWANVSMEDMFAKAGKAKFLLDVRKNDFI